MQIQIQIKFIEPYKAYIVLHVYWFEIQYNGVRIEERKGEIQRKGKDLSVECTWSFNHRKIRVHGVGAYKF